MSEHESKDMGVTGFGNPMKAMGTGHADEARVYVQYGNSLFEIGYRDTGLNVNLRKVLVDIAKEYVRIEENKIKAMK